MNSRTSTPARFLAISLLLMAVGCGGGGSGTTSSSDPAAEVPLAQRSVEVRVVFPSGADLDLTTSTLLARMAEQPLSPAGTGEALLIGDGRLLVALLDANGDPILHGYLTDDETALSVASTVEASLFIALGMYGMPAETQAMFWEQVRSFPGYPDAVADAEALLLEDPNFFQSEAFAEVMKTLLLSVEGSVHTEKIDIVNNNVRSGLQLEELSGDRVRVINTLRRRCHAFVYKLAFTDELDSETVLIQDVKSEDPAPRQDTASGPVSAYDSFLGTLQGAASGKGIEFFRTESSPLDVTLGPREKEVRYRVRVVGASAYTSDALSATENEKRQELELKTLALDLVLPILFDLAGQADFLKELKSSPDLESLGLLTVSTLRQIPALAEPIGQHDFGGALRATLEGLLNGQLAATFKPILERIAVYYAKRQGLEGEALTQFTKRADKLIKYLKITDAVLKANQYRELFQSVFQADALEDFEVTTQRGRVTLNPPYAVVVQGEKLVFTTTIQDSELDRGSYEYTWSTSGQYGELRDPLGQSGTSFVSSQKEVEFVTDAGVALPEGVQAIDVVQVKVAVKEGASITPIGEKSASVQVRELGFEIVPMDPELQGGESLTLRLQRTNGDNPFDSAFFDYKLVWETPGSFGFFDATTTSFTSSSSNAVSYSCLEEEEEGVEEVTARVYAKPKNSPDPFRFVDRVRTGIQIRNDPNIKIFYVARFTHIFDIAPAGGLARFSLLDAFRIPPYPGAELYTIKIVSWSGQGPSYLGRGRSWAPDDPSMRHASSPGDSFIYFPHGGTQTSSVHLGMALAYYGTHTAVAKVTVKLAP